jgi:hypothetical protein
LTTKEESSIEKDQRADAIIELKAERKWRKFNDKHCGG